jgi:hypothetical protein
MKTNSWQELSDFQRSILSLLICTNPQPELARMLLLGELRKQRGEDYLAKIAEGEDTRHLRKQKAKSSQEQRKINAINTAYKRLYEHEYEFLQDCKLPFILNWNSEFKDLFYIAPYDGENSYGGTDLYLIVRVDEYANLLDFQNLATYPIPQHLKLRINVKFNPHLELLETTEEELEMLQKIVQIVGYGLQVFPDAFYHIYSHDGDDYSFLRPLNHLQKNIDIWVDEEDMPAEEINFDGLQNIAFCYNAQTPDLSFKYEELETLANSETWRKNNLTIKYVR